MKLSEAQSAHVEAVGRWWESIAGSRNAGRILGWLMICDPPHQSSRELAETLHSSAGSVSTQARVLETVGFVERVTFRGDRSTYYQLRPDVWLGLMGGEHQRIRELRALAASASEVLPATRPDRVTDLGRIAQFFDEEWPGVIERLTAYLAKEKSHD